MSLTIGRHGLRRGGTKRPKSHFDDSNITTSNPSKKGVSGCISNELYLAWKFFWLLLKLRENDEMNSDQTDECKGRLSGGYARTLITAPIIRAREPATRI